MKRMTTMKEFAEFFSKEIGQTISEDELMFFNRGYVPPLGDDISIFNVERMTEEKNLFEIFVFYMDTETQNLVNHEYHKQNIHK